MANSTEDKSNPLKKSSQSSPGPSNLLVHQAGEDAENSSFISFNSQLSTPFDTILLAQATNLRAEVDNVKINLCSLTKTKPEEFALITPTSIKQNPLVNKITLATSLLAIVDLSEKVCQTVSGCRLSDSVHIAHHLQHPKAKSSPIKDPLKAIQASISDIKKLHIDDSTRFNAIEKQLCLLYTSPSPRD